ncbi:MAG: hypothetical protein SGILL_000956 [Bacillariaceae sp.]
MDSRDDMGAAAATTKPSTQRNLRQQGDRYSSASETEDDGRAPAVVRHTHTMGSESGTEHLNVNGLSWRSDPRKSFSDWTLEVIAMEDGVKKSTTLYHAHSNVIAWGPRRASFFVRLFQERMKQTPPSTVSRLQVQPSEAEVFPIMLDFIYCENSLPLSADRACTLYAIADKLGIPPLKRAIQKFVERYLSLAQMIEFIQYAQEQPDYHRKEIEKLVVCAVSKLCGYLVQHPLEAKYVQPSLLVYTLEQRAKFMKKLKVEDPTTYSGEWEKERSKLLSCVVAECCKEAARDFHKIPNGEFQNLSLEQFQQLLSHLPALESEAAMSLLQIDRKLKNETAKPSNVATAAHDQHQTSSSGSCSTDDEEKSKQAMTAVAFEDKCVQVLGAQWRKGMIQKSEKDNEALIEFLQELSPRVLAKLLVKVSQQYETDIVAAEESGLTSKHDILSQQSSTIVNINQPMDSSNKSNHDRFASEMADMYHLYDGAE